MLALKPSSLLSIAIDKDGPYAEISQPLWISSVGSGLLLFPPLFIAGGSSVLSGAWWEAGTKQLFVIAGALPSSRAPREARTRMLNKVRQQQGNRCSPLLDISAKW